MIQAQAKTKTQATELAFLCPLQIKAASGEDQSMPRFEMVAYTGGLMQVEGFDFPVVVDLEGLDISQQQIPIRLDHQARQGVGHTSTVDIQNGELVAEGLISRDTSWARDVAKSGSNGFPWQASIGASVIRSEFIPNGHQVEVNGQSFDGPIYIVREASLREISFVDSGADTKTSARVAAKKADDETAETKEDEQEETEEEETASDDVNANQTIQAMRSQIAGESRRIEAIRKICGDDHRDIEAKAIEEGWDTTKTELQVLRASRPQVPAMITTDRPRDANVFEAVAMMNAGLQASRLESLYTSQILEAADKLRGIGIQEFCELACGQQLPRFRRDASGWLQAAFSTTSLPGILSNIANKMLLEGYNYIEDTWRRICKIASVNDFKEHSRYRMTGSFKFEQVGADGELKHGQLDEQKFGQKADTHGIMFALTRQMIINDDMGAFTDIPRQIGMGAAEAIADAVWGLLLRNPPQADGHAFFSNDHKNLKTGNDSILNVDGLTAAEILFGQQIKPNGRPLGIQAALLLVPIALKVQAQLLMNSLQLNETTTANKAKPATNPHVGKFDVISSSYLSNNSFTGASSKAWYLFADPNRLPALEVAFLNGIDRPTVEKTDADFNTLGIQFRGFIDFGVREQDYRGALKMKGEA
ncbi:Mu-like prophage major head subunit gpT [Poriferisphaera corsica]|uniref:Mu-like prophage major head subunit gpT n=1 Tax=Poriferisphaera corsica TaxID=2528020 RepID=A0A517YS50_9BACT|nr:hypothetical protein [Poriferisphaera corsica]QDU33042.1 Mu-like prophage major head subunit gpT [Poriferisphaera corsica]